MTIVIIVIVVAVIAAGAYFAFARKGPEQLASGDAKKPDALPSAEKSAVEPKKAPRQDLVQTVRESPADRKPSLPAPSVGKAVSVPAPGTPAASAPPPSRP